MLSPIYFLIFFVGLAVSAAIAFWFPEYQKFYIKDNRVVENTGALLYLFAGLFSFVAAYWWQGKRSIPITFGLIGILCALDEISWGRDDLKFEPFQVMGVKIDALHDFSDVLSKAFSQYGENATFLLIAVGFIALLAWLMIRQRAQLVHFFAEERWMFFLLMVVFFVVATANDLVSLDVSKEAKNRLSLFEEYLELGAGLALLFIAISLWRQGRRIRY